MALSKCIPLNNGVFMPQLGLATGSFESKPADVEAAVKHALDVGCRLIDGGLVYMNEREVGAAIRAKIADGIVKREDLFIVSKLWNTYHHKDYVRKGLEKSLHDLGLDYIDLYLIHWPIAFAEGGEMFPRDKDGDFLFSNVDHLDTWKELEKLVQDGKIRSIGVCNFNSKQIKYLCDNCTIKPVINQVEINPYFRQDKLLAFCKERDIKMTAHSCLGWAERSWAAPEDPVLLEDPIIRTVADRLGKTTAQIVLRWAIQRGVICIPKSVTPSRITSNFQVFDFELSEDDMKMLSSFQEFRACSVQSFEDSDDYPFHDPF